MAGPRFDHWLQDVRFGVRILTHAPGLSAAAILLIALVIGGNATVYSMVNSILVSPASGVTRDDLVVIRHVDPAVSLTDPFVSFPNFEDYARHSTTVTGLDRLDHAATDTRHADRQLRALRRTRDGELFRDLRRRASCWAAGWLRSDDDAQDGVVVVISHRLWQERFNLLDDIVGRPITINRVPATIVGVAARGLCRRDAHAGRRCVDADSRLSPITNSEDEPGESRAAICADRRPPQSIRVARRGPLRVRDAVRRNCKARYPDAFTTYSPKGVVPLRNARAVVSRYSATALLPIADMAPVFLAVFSVVTLLTLIVVCANVANLLLGRAVERQRDTAVRLSLGASRARIVRMLLAEGATLAIAAWIAAYVIALWTSQALLRIIEPRPGLLANARPDWTLAAYGLTMAFVATLVFSLAPALRSWRVPISPLLKAGEHGIAAGRSRWATALVVVQFAFSVVLVTAAGLAYRSMTTLSSVDLGFSPDNILLVTVRLGDDGRRRRVRAPRAGPRAPGRDSGSRSSVLCAPDSRSHAAGLHSQSAATSSMRRRGLCRQVGPDYLRVLGLHAIAGRELTASERRGGTRVAMINQQLAADLFGNEPPLGRQLLFGERDQVEVVGVVADALFDGPNRDPHPRYLFLAEQQMPGPPPADPTSSFAIAARLEALTPLVTRAIGEVDAGVPIVVDVDHDRTTGARLRARGADREVAGGLRDASRSSLRRSAITPWRCSTCADERASSASGWRSARRPAASRRRSCASPSCMRRPES